MDWPELLNVTDDPTRHNLREIIQKGQTWISKASDVKLLKFSKILPTITITGNGILLKDDRIILPESLHLEAIQLEHQGSHSGETGIQRRLRYHFFFHEINEKLHSHISPCKDCQIFTNKKTSEPIAAHAVPNKCWDKVSVDLFGPMPSKRQIIVVQDLASRFPVLQCVPLQIIKVEDGGRRLTMKRISNGKLYQRHPDDIKLYNDSLDIPEETENTLILREEEDVTNWQEISHKIIHDEYEDCDNDRNIPIINNAVTGASFLPRPI